MSIQEFPEIETFQKLPHRVIVKGGNAGFNAKGKPELRGLIINNVGHAIKQIRVSLIVFNEREMPVLNTSVASDPAMLAQGGMASFVFTLNDYEQEITNYYLYANWKYDDSNL
ncbi:MAG: hypothetical protein COV74_10760 [Candidatus Omnitrophica bacterium CG11_big_fil_rev_8_21_14_0_20_45_26]|uniref:Uncharacterized protein n=1 Tax=Candidatus Abzuiibacterium crystallinum TaxID=1974748 RepID=A0A2H0LKY3_9BACT|nr:MAG: hypothetical protein COV74_10760 [Candidatus Omnitrophica bacterium CG11_big_fil_rev_8_21_14_0_20_45_26]PIW63854.1 MAG: hypothetical protein COW12_08050 [Candidatus Omnitrophica bacterium CG12_big_fil_rev_8_21_14_0_65_45_16]